MLSRLPLLAWVLAIALLAVARPVDAAESFEAMLQRADAVRSTDPAEFSSLLGRLNGMLAQANQAQRLHLRYLEVYELGYTGRFDQAISDATQLFADVDDPSLKLRAGALIVNSHAATRNFSEGLRYLDMTLELIDRVPDPELRSHGWFAAAALYNQLGQFELSQFYAEQILAVSTVPRTRCFAGQQRLEALYQLDQLPREDTVTEQVIEQCEQLREGLVAGFGRVLLARQRAKRGETAAAIELMESNLPRIEATGYPRLIGDAQSLLGELHLAQGNVALAEAHAREAVKRSVDIGHSLPLVQAHATLYRTALLRGDQAAALEHHIRFAEADKAYLDHVKARELAFQMIRHEMLQKSQTIELLNKENQVLVLEQVVASKSAQATRLLVLLLAVLLASLAYWGYRTKRTQGVLRRLAQTDALTGLANRSHFTRRAEQALVQCRKSGQHAGLVMLDLDNFKAINDQHGHATGDWALRQVSRVCEQVRREGDLVGRLGGEEFAFLLLDCDLESSGAIARQCRERIAAIDTLPSGHLFRLTASFGVAGTQATGHGLDALLAQSDSALYRSKREGRDRVTVQTVAVDSEATTARPA